MRWIIATNTTSLVGSTQNHVLALLKHALKKKWVTQELDSRALAVTSLGKREMLSKLGVQV